MKEKKVVGKNKKRQEKLKKNLSAKIKKNDGKKSPEEILKDSGYSESYARGGHWRKTDAWLKILDDVLPESFLAEKHKQLITSGQIQHYIFPPVKEVESQDGDKLEEELEPQGNGGALKRRKKKKPIIKKGLSHEEIKQIVESVPGCKLIYIKNDSFLGQVAFFQSPDNRTQKDALDMAYKLRGSFAPEKHAVYQTGLEDLSDEELAMALEDKNFLIQRYKKYGLK